MPVEKVVVNTCLIADKMFGWFPWLLWFIQLWKGKISRTDELIPQQKRGDFRQLTAKSPNPTGLGRGLTFQNHCVITD